MNTLRKLFGPSKAEIWRQLCTETGADFVQGGFWKGDKVQATHAEWTITLACLTEKDNEGYWGADFPADTDELCFHVCGIIKDVERLKLLFELFAETLDQLCRIGSAYEEAPKLKL